MGEPTKELIDILITQNANYRDMMQFAVGSILTILVIFLGAHFFTMRSFKKDELLRLKSDLELKIRNEFLQELEAELRENIKQGIKNELESANRQIKTIEFELKSMKKYIKSTDAINNKNNKVLKSQMLCLEADLWFSQKSYSNALRTYTEAGMIAIEKDKGSVNYILYQIEETIDNVTDLTTWDRNAIQRLLDKLSPEHNATKENIIKKINIST